jgi:hypothetical protein
MTKLLSDDLYTICTTKIFSQTTLNVIGSMHEIDKINTNFCAVCISLHPYVSTWEILRSFCVLTWRHIKKKSQAILILNILHVCFHATVFGKERTWKLCTAIRNVPSQIKINAKHSGLVVFTISARKITFSSYFLWAT